ncbi:uncharacterized protein ACNLHF_002192 [Anomaloglossus baeobatrachus]
MFRGGNMAARSRSSPWGPVEVRYLVKIMVKKDYFCEAQHDHPMLHKQAVLRLISRGLARRFGVERSTTQIRKKLADLRYKSSELLASIRADIERRHGPPPAAQAAPPSPPSPAVDPQSPPAPASPAAEPSSPPAPTSPASDPPPPPAGTPSPSPTPSPAATPSLPSTPSPPSTQSPHTSSNDAFSPASVATGSGWAISASEEEEGDEPQNQIPTLQDVLDSQRHLSEAVRRHGELLEQFLAAQQQGH